MEWIGRVPGSPLAIRRDASPDRLTTANGVTMSSYVDSVLAEGERIVYRAAISQWKFFGSYFLGGLFLLAALGAYLAIGDHTDAALALSAILLVIGLAVILSAVIRRQTTELVLTDRRIITKRGLVSRQVARQLVDLRRHQTPERKHGSEGNKHHKQHRRDSRNI